MKNKKRLSKRAGSKNEFRISSFDIDSNEFTKYVKEKHLVIIEFFKKDIPLKERNENNRSFCLSGFLIVIICFDFFVTSAHSILDKNRSKI